MKNIEIDNFPKRIVLELTPICNLNCSMCPRHYIDESEGFMDSELWKKLIDEINIENRKSIVLPFWRGESCLHPEFLELMQYAIDKGLRLHLSTNGHFMDEKFQDIFYKCEFVTFSIHTDIGYKNAVFFADSKPSWSKTNIQISFVDSEKSVKKFMNSVINDTLLHGFDSVRLYIEHTIGGKFGKSKTDIVRRERIFCPKLVDTFVVACDGSFSRCNHIWDTNDLFNLKVMNIKNIWNSSEMNEIRECYPDKICFPCDQWTGHTNGKVWRKQNGLIKFEEYGV